MAIGSSPSIPRPAAAMRLPSAGSTSGELEFEVSARPVGFYSDKQRQQSLRDISNRTDVIRVNMVSMVSSKL